MSDVLDPSLHADATPAAFAEAMARAEHGKQPVLVMRDGRAVAVLVPIEDVEALEALEDAEDSRLAAEAIARWEAEARPRGRSLHELAARWGIDPTSDPE
jgi:prevent-host-death family protein